MKIFGYLLVIFIALTACTPSRSQHITMLNPTEFQEAVASGDVQLVDVRTQREFAQGHIPGALQIDYMQRSTFYEQFEYLDKEKPVYIYCLHGPRSRGAARILEDMGFTQIYDLRGGYQAWLRR